MVFCRHIEGEAPSHVFPSGKLLTKYQKQNVHIMAAGLSLPKQPTTPTGYKSKYHRVIKLSIETYAVNEFVRTESSEKDTEYTQSLQGWTRFFHWIFFFLFKKTLMCCA
ncbi:hypothetical protein XENOCAPTIV_000946 [Xenoophorus captivus]|uniref:Uncharacterized protein n=1 Tax=Xenoophorus captivus TaxID=1517983 RepID=A0ABV0SFA2_9TELE